MFKLRVFIEDEDLKNIYKQHIEAHNNKIRGALDSNGCFDAGFDLICPENYQVQVSTCKKLSMKIKCAGFYNERPSGYVMWPRSSISKTPLRLANSAGIIDSGYRGELIGAFDCIQSLTYADNEDYKEGFVRLTKGNKYLQLCAPDMSPIIAELVDNLDDLGVTSRGAGGFGSTGN